jgi:histidine ammonia-lyase
MVLRARSLAMGCSGARPELVEQMLALLNAGLTPIVPEHGSLGCSGDLAPMAHIALALIGEGQLHTADNRVVDSTIGLQGAGVEPIELEAKEGLALINGTDGMLGMLVLAVEDLRGLLRAVDITAAMSVEGLLGTDAAFAADLIALRPHPGQQESAANLRAVLHESAIVASHKHDDPRVQDAYSVRCTPQVHGTGRDALAYVEQVCERELRSAIDNPIVRADGQVSSNGNFHGSPLALAADMLGMAVADVMSIAERRIDRLLDPTRSHGLPAFLAADPGVDSGLMIAQYTAAALVSDAKRLAVPASVDSIPTSAMQEDHVSMGWAAARKLRVAVDHLATVIGIELLAAGRAIDLRRPLTPAAGTKAALDALREVVDGPAPDRWLAPDIAHAAERVRNGAIVEAVEQAVGGLR